MKSIWLIEHYPECSSIETPPDYYGFCKSESEARLLVNSLCRKHHFDQVAAYKKWVDEGKIEPPVDGVWFITPPDPDKFCADWFEVVEVSLARPA